jgi:hypothetical protein
VISIVAVGGKGGTQQFASGKNSSRLHPIAMAAVIEGFTIAPSNYDTRFD